MTTFYWMQLILFLLVTILTAQLVGSMLYKALSPLERPFLAIIIEPIEKLTYKVLRIDTEKEHSWKGYLFCFLSVSALSIVFVMCIVLLQQHLPLNPEKFSAPSLSLAFNIAVGFSTNTDWQCYSGESMLSMFSQMAALAVQNFISPAIGIASAAALVRSLCRAETKTLGNFWVDVIRVIYYVLLPLSILFATLFIMEGCPQNFHGYTRALTLEGREQLIVQGPIASQEAIKLLASNGGGYTGANSAHPYENPSPFSNMLEIFCMILLPVAQLFYFGKCIKSKKHVWSILFSITCIFLAAVTYLTYTEAIQNPFLSLLKISPDLGNMEGKEVRFGLFGSTLFTAISSASSNGATASAVTSYQPLAGMTSLLYILLGQTLFGSVGTGLHSIVVVVIICLYLLSLMSGRAPEYLGKKLGIFDIKMTIISTFGYVAIILTFTSLALTSSWGREAILSKGPHGFTEIFYLFSSTADGNGSSLIGPSTNTDIYNIIISAVMLLSRLGVITIVLSLAGSLAKKKVLALNGPSIACHGLSFSMVLIAVILIIGAMSFLPALFIGPILENLQMNQGHLF